MNISFCCHYPVPTILIVRASQISNSSTFILHVHVQIRYVKKLQIVTEFLIRKF